MSILNQATNTTHVGVVVIGGAVVHNRGKAQTDRLLDHIQVETVVKVQNNRNGCLLCQRDEEGRQILKRCERRQNLCSTDDNGSAQLFSGRDNTLSHLQVDRVEQTDRILLGFCARQDIIQSY